jgi:hypothetical protein
MFLEQCGSFFAQIFIIKKTDWSMTVLGPKKLVSKPAHFE